MHASLSFSSELCLSVTPFLFLCTIVPVVHTACLLSDVFFLYAYLYVILMKALPFEHLSVFFFSSV